MTNLEKINEKYLYCIQNIDSNSLKEIKSLSYLLNYPLLEEFKNYFYYEDWTLLDQIIEENIIPKGKYKFDSENNILSLENYGDVFLLDPKVLAENFKIRPYLNDFEKNLWHLFFLEEDRYFSCNLYYVSNLKD